MSSNEYLGIILCTQPPKTKFINKRTEGQ